MLTFQWEGLSPRGERLTGRLRAASRDAALARLRARGIVPLPERVLESRDRPRQMSLQLRLPQRVRRRDVALFARQLAAMIAAGLPVVEALEVLSQRSGDARLSRVLAAIKTDVESGVPLADALGRHSRVFDELFVNMIAVGETSGALDRVLLRVAGHIEKTSQLAEKVTRALIYPAAVVGVAGCVTAALLIYVIPVFADLFHGFGQVLPLPTRAVIAASSLATAYGIYFIALLMLAGAVAARLRSSASGRALLDQWVLRAPLVGPLLAQAAVVRVTGSLATLLCAGVALLEALAIAAATAGNKVVERVVLAARAAVESGRPLADELRDSGVFAPLVCQMIAVGERTGALDTMLESATAFCEEEIDRSVATLMALLEPAIMVILGIIMGALVVSMYLPVFQLGNVL
jgi:type IV pilus assembly protein PilC